jgi:CHAD domain-containing protein
MCRSMVQQMATPTEFHEDDKLGPIGGKTAVLDSDSQLRMMLVHEFREAAEAAKKAASKTEADAKHAIHDSRKALRRARAVLELLADALPKSEYKAVRRVLQESRRALSTVRDHGVAPDTFAKLTLDDEDRSAAKQILDSAAEAMPPVAEVKKLLADAAGKAAAQVDALEAALPQELHWSTVGVGLRSVYGEARAARKKAKKSAAAFHSWRRRSKELVYQLAILAEHAGGRTLAIHDEVAAITGALSDAVDIIMLSEFCDTFGQGVAPEALEKLQATIHEHLGDLMKTARKAAKGPFESGSKAFAKRVGKAVRKDLAPAAESQPSAD